MNSLDDLKKLNKNKKLVRKLAQSFDSFLASPGMIAKIPRVLGPSLYRAGKFPVMISHSDDPEQKVIRSRTGQKRHFTEAGAGDSAKIPQVLKPGWYRAGESRVAISHPDDIEQKAKDVEDQIQPGAGQELLHGEAGAEDKPPGADQNLGPGADDQGGQEEVPSGEVRCHADAPVADPTPEKGCDPVADERGARGLCLREANLRVRMKAVGCA